MFSDESDNYKMLLGSYRKLKSYYHYNKNFLFMREKIASFEYDEEKMDMSLKKISRILQNPHNNETTLDAWIQSISYYVLPKSFSVDKTIEERFVTSSLPNKSVARVNFFIDMPIELHLIETLWTIIVARISEECDVFLPCSYGNAIDDRVLFDTNVEGIKESIRFEKKNLFKVYYPQYCAWKNNAIKTIEKNKNDKNSILFSLDIKSFYYSVCWKFELLNEILVNDKLAEIAALTQVVKRIYEKYTALINEIRVLPQNLDNNECVLPIGLFSSMLIANLYMVDFDKRVQHNTNVLYYGRYVDDILLLIDTKSSDFSADDMGIDKILVFDNDVLDKIDNKSYCLSGRANLIIQREKLKVLYFERGKSDELISQLKKTNYVPSQMNVIPQNDIRMVDFEEAAYALHNITSETKIRDLGQLEIDRLKLAIHMAELVRGSRYSTAEMLTNEEKFQRQNERDKVIHFFSGSNAVEYNSNWINAMYFILLTSNGKKTGWNQLEEGIRLSIKGLTVRNLEDVRNERKNGTKSKMKKDLNRMFDICVATALAINPTFSKKEKKEISDLCYRIRSANLINHYLVSFPLMNYSDDVDKDLNLAGMRLNSLKNEYFDIENSRKMQLSPRFINFDELYHYYYIRSIILEKSSLGSESIFQNIWETFIRINHINADWAKPLEIKIENAYEQKDIYKIRRIVINNNKRNLQSIRIAIANVKLSIESCCMGLNESPVIRNRLSFISFLNEAYNDNRNKVDYLVFPEFYMPLAWMQDVLKFVRNTGITVVSGIQYICKNSIAHNTVGVFASIKSGKYNSACVFVREKNNYAPLEKRLLATEGYSVLDREKPIYTWFEEGKVRFGVFLCYEFTDICARGLFKDKADIIFIPENNRDTAYFASIIETMTRDVHAFMVQSNTSNYGDSRISGPYSRDHRNVVQIKGGDNDSLIIGTVDIQAIIDHRAKERKDMEVELDKIFAMSPIEKKRKRAELEKEQDRKIAKVSARTFF